jgi:hypothetical protein
VTILFISKIDSTIGDKMNKYILLAFTLLFSLNLSCKKMEYYNVKAVETKIIGLEVNTGNSINTIWKFTAENKMNKDYYLPENQNAAYIMLNAGGGLSQEKEINWKPGIYLPPNEKISISFQVTYEYSDSCKISDKNNLEKLSKFIKPKINEIESFVIIDKKNKYKIIFKNDYNDTTKIKRLDPIL